MDVRTFVKNALFPISSRIARHPRSMAVGALLVAAAIAFLAFHGSGNTALAPIEQPAPTVQVVPLAELASDGSTLSMLGEVRSVAQAELHAEKAGRVTSVAVRSGQPVAAGVILAEIENASERATVLQAQAGVAAARAQLARIQNGARSEDKASATSQADSALIALDAARDAAQTTCTDSYSAAADAIYAKADTLFTDPYTVRPSLRITSISFDENRSLSDERVALGSLLAAWKRELATPIDSTTYDSHLRSADERLARVGAFLETVSNFVSKQEITSDLTSATKSAQEGAMLAARSGVAGARAGISGARQGLANAENAARVSSISESRIIVGERPEDITTAQAALAGAQAALAGAQANLERTLIRTPISGNVSSLSVSPGDYVGMQQSIAIVANPGAMEVIAHVSDDARARIAPGMHVRIADEYDGTVTSRDSGLDPATGRARITVGLAQGVPLTNGSYVTVSLETGSTTRSTHRAGWYVPVSAIKVQASGLALFTVTENNTLRAIPITEGMIIGDRMVVTDPLAPELHIVKDARGRVDGETVTPGA